MQLLIQSRVCAPGIHKVWVNIQKHYLTNAVDLVGLGTSWYVTEFTR